MNDKPTTTISANATNSNITLEDVREKVNRFKETKLNNDLNLLKAVLLYGVMVIPRERHLSLRMIEPEMMMFVDPELIEELKKREPDLFIKK